MIGRFKLVMVMVSFSLLLVASVQADKLCLKNSLRVNNGKAKLSNVLRVSGDCPARYIEILDTDLFQGPAGQDGADGSDGAPGQDGLAGQNGATNSVIRAANSQPVGQGTTVTTRVNCQAGEVAVGGGAGLTNGFTDDVIFWSSRPVDSLGNSTAGNVPTGWIGSMQHLGGHAGNYSYSVWVVCVSP